MDRVCAGRPTTIPTRQAKFNSLRKMIDLSRPHRRFFYMNDLISLVKIMLCSKFHN